MLVIICFVALIVIIALILLGFWILRSSGESQCKMLPGTDLGGEIGSYIPLGGTRKASKLAKECDEEATRRWKENETIPGHEEISLDQMKREIRCWVRRKTCVTGGAMCEDFDPPEDEFPYFPTGWEDTPW